jgi:RNA polymerase-binding transcription factor DksA
METEEEKYEQKLLEENARIKRELIELKRKLRDLEEAKYEHCDVCGGRVVYGCCACSQGF